MVKCPKCGYEIGNDDYHYQNPEWMNLPSFDSKIFHDELESRIKRQEQEFQESTQKQKKMLELNEQEKIEFALLEVKAKKKMKLRHKLKVIDERQSREIESGNYESYHESQRQWKNTLNEIYDNKEENEDD